MMSAYEINDNYNSAIYEDDLFDAYEDLFGAYVRPSDRKINRWERICKDCEQNNGWDLRICEFNSSAYSVGYKFEDEETGQIMLKYFTRDNTYVVEWL